MKAILIFVILTVGSIQIHAQVYRLDSLNARQARFIRSAVVGLASPDSTFWANDSLSNIIRSATTQLNAGSTNITLRLNRSALIEVIRQVMGGLTSNLDQMRQEQAFARQQLQAINTKIAIIKAIREVERRRNIPKNNSIFEQLNTGFLDRNNFNTLNSN